MRFPTRYLAGLRPWRQQLLEKRSAGAWLRIFVVAGLFGGLLGGASSSCVVADPDYCVTREQCPSVETDLGMMQLLCHPTRHVCIRADRNTCFTDMDCISDYKKPRCDTGTNTCIACDPLDSSDTSCAHFGDRKICVNATDGSGSLCVGCRTNLDCPGTAPICDNQLCRPCSQHSDCEGELNCDNNARCTNSLVCIQAGDLGSDLIGRCAQNGSAASGRVIYVNNTDVTKCGTAIGATGTTFDSPLCGLSEALDTADLQSRHFIRAVGANLVRINQTILRGSYTFIGAPTKTTNPVYKDMAQVDVRDTFATINGTAMVTFDQFDLREANPGDKVLIRCAQSGQTVPGLTLKRSILSGGTMPNMAGAVSGALVLSGCQAVIDGNIIGVRSMTELSNPAVPVHGSAIVVVDSNSADVQSSYLIQNNLIAGNASYGINLTGALGASSKFMLRFNTIIGNGRGLSGQPGGVVCPGGNTLREFSHSIIYNNSGSSQFQGITVGCSFKDIVTGTGESGTDAAFVKSNPDLDEMFRLRATAPNTDCCIDKITPVGAETLPSQDIDGTPRPQNGKWDVGASELKK